MNHKQSLDRPTTLPTRKANPQTTKRHQVPSRSPSLNQPSLTARSKTFHLPLFQRTPYLSLISSSKYVPKRDMGAMQVGTLNHSYQWAGPQRDRPRRNPSHTLPTSGTLKPHQEQTSSLGWSEPPSVGTPARLPRTHKARAAPAAATRPGEGDVFFQHRVHRGHKGGGGAGV